MTREKGKALLLTLHLQPFICCFSLFFRPPCSISKQRMSSRVFSLNEIIAIVNLYAEPLLFVLKITQFVVKIFSPLAKRC